MQQREIYEHIPRNIAIVRLKYLVFRDIHCRQKALSLDIQGNCERIDICIFEIGIT